MHNGKAEVPF